MRQYSKKRAATNRAASKVRIMLVKEIGCCMNCGHSEFNYHHLMPLELSRLSCHEIARGKCRLLFLTERCGLLVLCQLCNQYEFDDAKRWPEARQLALLQARATQWYDLERYNFIINPRAPRRIDQAEVDAYKETISDAA